MSNEPIIIDLGLAGQGPVGRRVPQMSVRLRRGLAGALTAVLCLGTAAGSTGGGPTGLGRPLWTGSVSLNGFSLGSQSLYQATPDAKVVIGRDLATGRVRWRLAVDGADLPDTTTDVGHGVAAVVTRRLAQAPERPVYTITFVREATGDRIGQTTGYFFTPSADGDPLVVFTDRGLEADCRPDQLSCLDVTAWDVPTATVRWRLHLPPGRVAIPSFGTEGTFDGLADVASDGTVRLRDLTSNAVVSTIRLPTTYLSDGQVVLTREALVTALRGERGIIVTAYRRPALTRMWSVTVTASAAPEAAEYRFRGGIRLSDCGSDIVCLYPDRLAGRIIAVPTGEVLPVVRYGLIHGLGNGLFLAAELGDDPPTPVNARYIVDHTGRIVATLPVSTRVPWADNRGGVLVTREGTAGTEFIVIDEYGHRRSVGTVSGTQLSCLARGRFLSCADRVGTLRTWRLPSWTAGT